MVDDDNLRSNRNDPCEKGGNHSWIGDDAGDSWCTKCGESLIDG